MSYEKKLAEIGVTLPPPPAAAGAYVPWVRVGNLLFLSGTLPIENGKVAFVGKISPTPESIAFGYKAARQCALNTLANIRAALGTLDNVARIVSVNGFVNGIDDFSESAKVINGASELFGEIFGEAGKHSRAAVSVNGLPLNASAEISVIIEVK